MLPYWEFSIVSIALAYLLWDSSAGLALYRMYRSDHVWLSQLVHLLDLSEVIDRLGVSAESFSQ